MTESKYNPEEFKHYKVTWLRGGRDQENPPYAGQNR